MALYKQTRSAIAITVEGKGISGSRGTKTAAEKTPKEDTAEEKKKKQNSIKRVVTKQALNMVRSGTNFVVGNIATYSGDSNFQAQVQRDLEITADVLQTTVTSAFAFAVNPALGAMTLGASALSQTLKYEQRNISQATQEFKQSQSVNYAKARSGIDLTDGRTRLR